MKGICVIRYVSIITNSFIYISSGCHLLKMSDYIYCSESDTKEKGKMKDRPPDWTENQSMCELVFQFGSIHRTLRNHSVWRRGLHSMLWIKQTQISTKGNQSNIIEQTSKRTHHVYCTCMFYHWFLQWGWGGADLQLCEAELSQWLASAILPVREWRPPPEGYLHWRGPSPTIAPEWLSGSHLPEGV